VLWYPFSPGRERQDVISDGSLFYMMYNKDHSLSMGIFPLASSYNSAVAVDTWHKCMDRIGIDKILPDHVLATAVKAIRIGFSSMVDMRYIAITEQRRIGNVHQGLHD
jgi:hypothetical protein